MLTAFTAALLLTTVSEIGDKTFFIAAILAMRHSRRVVFAGASAALAVMTVLSVGMGQVASLLPEHYVAWAEILLFLGFGLKLLYDASQMSPKDTPMDECKQTEAEINQLEAKSKRRTQWTVLAQAFGMTFLAEWGDRTQFTTIALAAANNPVGVTLGAILGHAICAAIAVQCGRYVCGKLSERTLTSIGGALFLLFASVSFVELIR
ncbi:MAG: TMEM165/GDT1 family protein [Oscillatoriophycideae cyanobacterium NC_groundwater_1537_Pr4_S-0.65um_50_18]|nr:TMEM165/GDT1 family protein [Oscillatoriophycideae cyanobacterium NC_groundwater_1537_Pr4_S-0.65um_50_18]